MQSRWKIMVLICCCVSGMCTNDRRCCVLQLRHANGTMRPGIQRHDQTWTEPVANTSTCSVKNAQVISGRPPPLPGRTFRSESDETWRDIVRTQHDEHWSHRAEIVKRRPADRVCRIRRCRWIVGRYLIVAPHRTSCPCLVSFSVGHYDVLVSTPDFMFCFV